MAATLRFELHFSGPHMIEQEQRAERLLAQSGRTEHGPRARLHAILAASRLLAAPELAAEAAAEAAREAEKAGDQVSRAWSLLAASVVDVSPTALPQRLAQTREVLRIAQQTGEVEFVPIAYFLHLGALLEHGAIAELDLALSPSGALLSVLPWLEQDRHVAWFRCVRASIDGQTERAEQLAGDALTVAEQNGDPDALSVWVGQLAIVRWMQGRVVEFEPAFLQARQAAPHEPVWAVSLAWMWLKQGRRSAAHALITSLPPIAELPVDRNWLATACILAVVAAELGAARIAADVREALLPFDERLATIGLGVTCWGTVARALGVVALALGETDAATSHYRKAVEVAARVGAHPWLAEVQTELASILAARATPADRAEAFLLASEAVATGRALQLPGIEEAAAVVLEALKDHGEPRMRTSSAPDGEARPRITILGSFDVVAAEGTPAHWQSRKARELLKILVTKRGVAVGRETVMHLLWPDESPEKLANRFSVAASAVRRALDPAGVMPTHAYLEIRGSVVRLCVERIDVDVERFLAASQAALALSASVGEATEPLREALELYRGDALADDPEALWAEELRREVHLAFFAVAHALAEASEAQGDALTRLDCYRRILAVDSYDQRTHQGLIETLAELGATGQLAAARTTYVQRMGELGITVPPR